MFVALVLLSVVHWRYLRLSRAEESFSAFVASLRAKQFPDAERRIKTSLAISPNNAHYLSNAALLHERMLQYRFDFDSFRSPELSAAETEHVKTAVQLYQRVLQLNPHDDHASHNLGWLFWLLKDRQQAFAYLQQATAINDGLPLYHISLGMLHEYNGEFDAAYQEYSRAIRISPGVADSRFFADLQKRSPQQAEKIISDAYSRFEEQVRLGGGATVKAKLGKLAVDRQPELAAQVLKEVTAEISNLSRPWINLGTLYEQQGADDRAELSYRKSIFIDGGETSVWFLLGRLYDRKGNTQSAIAFYRRAIQSWIDQASAHSGFVRRVYVSRYAVKEDVIPNGLTSYTNPALDIDWACSRLAALYRQQGNEALEEQYENLRKEYAQ
jgi:tetratricopeptide (TPR) repeat protein